MTTPTIKDLIKFVLKNRKDKSFPYYSIGQIAYMIMKGLESGTLYFAQSLDGNIIGMILAEKDDKKKVLFVIENLSMSIANLKTFYKKAFIDFPGYTFESMRHGRHIKYNQQFVDRKFLS